MGSTILEIVLGAVIAILITIWVENLKKPRLTIQIARPGDRRYEGRPAKRAKFLYVEVANNPLPRWARWMSRDAATQCHGTVSFYHLDGGNLFGRSMPVRWSTTPEPAAPSFRIDDKLIVISDPTRFNMSARVDIYPGEKEPIDIAAKFDDEMDCYGWSNESYFSEPVWRNPRWRVAPGRYLVKVVVTSSGEKASAVFRLINDVPIDDFRLEPKLKGDKTHD